MVANGCPSQATWRWYWAPSINRPRLERVLTTSTWRSRVTGSHVSTPMLLA